MFRAKKPLLQRTPVKKTDAADLAEVNQQVPSAIVPHVPPPAVEQFLELPRPKTPPRFRARDQEQEEEDESGEELDVAYGDVEIMSETSIDMPDPAGAPLPIPAEVTAEDVELWEERHAYRPCVLDDEYIEEGDCVEERQRQVREDRKILPHHDPLIDDMLDLLPDVAGWESQQAVGHVRDLV